MYTLFESKIISPVRPMEYPVLADSWTMAARIDFNHASPAMPKGSNFLGRKSIMIAFFFQ